MVKKFRCESCGGGELTILRKEIYEQNGGSYHLAVSFNGNRRVFKCTECGKIWYTDPTSEYIHFLSANTKSGRILSFAEENSHKIALKTG